MYSAKNLIFSSFLINSRIFIHFEVLINSRFNETQKSTHLRR
jgi:hypothetical protein